MKNINQNKEWEAVAILQETRGKYLIQWAGINPITKQPWGSTWEPKRMANKALVKDFKKRNQKQQRNGRNSGVQEGSCELNIIGKLL